MNKVDNNNHSEWPAEAISQFATINGFNVHYRIAGKGEPLVMLLHGSFLSIRSWRLVFGELAKHTTVVAFDRPAFGKSSKPRPSTTTGANYSPEAQSDLVIALMRHVGFQKAMLVGNSTGGTLALLAALRHPNNVAAIALAGAMVYSGYATSGIPAPLKPLFKAASPLFARLMGKMITKLYDRTMYGFWHNKERLSPDVVAAFRNDFMQGEWARGFWELFLETHHLHFEERLKGIVVPSLVITGDNDLTVKTAESERLANELPGAALAVIANCGHLPQEEQPEAFVQALLPFIEKVRLHL
uniref:Hydrolase, alpha/beta hydrolase fold family n=1 Tax=Chlorobium chlorochromatii (strain CaD3) TaxID=340177 RepID=Q3ASC2_CHLCH